MPQKRATFMIYESDPACDDARQFIEDAGVRLDVRKLKERPLTVRELDLLFGHNPLSYFINVASDEYSNLGLDKRTPERAEMLQILADNNNLLRTPIIKTVRLLTIGCNKEKITEVLQLGRNGDSQDEVTGPRIPRITRRALPGKK